MFSKIYRRFPHYPQHDGMDCGATALRMVAKYYGKGRLYNIHQDYDKHTGLYTIDFSCEVVPMHIPVLIQYRESVTVTVDVSHETVVQKLLGDRLRMDEK